MRDDDSNLDLASKKTIHQHRKTEPPQKSKMEAYMYVYIVMCV